MPTQRKSGSAKGAAFTQNIQPQIDQVQFQQNQECFQLQQAQRQELLQLQQAQAQELRQLQQAQAQQFEQLTQRQRHEMIKLDEEVWQGEYQGEIKGQV